MNQKNILKAQIADNSEVFVPMQKLSGSCFLMNPDKTNFLEELG